MNKYVHGYSQREAKRLNDQADSVAQILHHDTFWQEGSLILEAGCGVGAQTKTIAPKNPKCSFISIDRSLESISLAKRLTDSMGIDNVEYRKADIFNLPFEDECFDHVFVCFVLEHIANPIDALRKQKRVLKPDGTITVIEGDHGSTYFHPDSVEAKIAIQCQVILQQQKGGDANIGRKLYPILEEAGFTQIKISPRQVYVGFAEIHQLRPQTSINQ